MKKRPKMRAGFVQTLVYYDEPILALLENRKGTYLLAYALGAGAVAMADPYIAKPVAKSLLDSYLQQKVDLSFVMRDKRTGEPFIFDWSEFEDEVVMTPAEMVSDDYKSLLPEPGFFARNHTEAFLGKTIVSLVKHAYKIDGGWSASDFSRFYSKLADLYSLFSYLGDLRSSKSIVSNGLAATVSRYPWQGGGSYLGFFRDIATESRDDYPLQVSKIQYASPGQIEVKGVAESLYQIDALIGVFDHAKSHLAEIYRELRATLERDGVLGTDATDFSHASVGAIATSRADALLREMQTVDVDAVRDACEGREVAFAKIAMAIYRRGLDFHRFHAEGRMQLPDRRDGISGL